MKKLTALLFVLLCGAPVARGQTVGVGGVTVASLPAAAANKYRVAIVTDGNAAGDCTTGGGSNLVLCVSNGTAWTTLGDGNSGGAPAFSSITSGTNTGATMTVGTGASIAVSGSGTVSATDLACADCVALATETTGNYVADVAAGSALDLSVSGTGSENATATVSFPRSATLAGNPVIGVNTAVFGANGIMFEGSTADTFEGLLTAADPTADRTWTLPNGSGNILLGPGGNGIVVRTSAGITTNRTLTAASTLDHTITNGDGTGGNPTIALARSSASDLGLSANFATWSSTGILFEGATADAVETRLVAADPTSADKTITLPDETGTVCTTGSVCTGYEAETHASEHAENAADEILGEDLGTACTNGQIWKANASGGVDCAADATGGSPSFDLITTGTNTTATMTVGTGASLTTSGSGTITATALANADYGGVSVASNVFTVDAHQEVNLAETGSVPWDARNGCFATINGATGNITLDITNNQVCPMRLTFIQDAVGGRTLKAESRTVTVNGGANDTTLVSVIWIDELGISQFVSSADLVDLTSEVTGTLPVANGGTGVTSLTDLVTPTILDDDANSPAAGDLVIVETGAASFDYLTPNAGTDVTADLEEETHASEHAENAADELFVENLGTACTNGQVVKGDGTGGLACGTDNTGGSTLTDVRVSVMWHPATIPASNGNCYFEPYTVQATNDNWAHKVLVCNDTATKDGFYSLFNVPADYTDAAEFVVVWTSTATSGNFQIDIDYRCIGGDDTESLDQATAVESLTTADVAPSATDERMTATLAATDGNFAVGETCEIFVGRDGATESSGIADEVVIFDVYFQYDQ